MTIESRVKRMTVADETLFVEQLSPRELEVLELAADGLSNQEIADLLFLSERTARTHMHNILQKLGVSNRTAAVVRGQDLGIVPVRLDTLPQPHSAKEALRLAHYYMRLAEKLIG